MSGTGLHGPYLSPRYEVMILSNRQQNYGDKYV